MTSRAHHKFSLYQAEAKSFHDGSSIRYKSQDSSHSYSRHQTNNVMLDMNRRQASAGQQPPHMVYRHSPNVNIYDTSRPAFGHDTSNYREPRLSVSSANRDGDEHKYVNRTYYREPSIEIKKPDTVKAPSERSVSLYAQVFGKGREQILTSRSVEKVAQRIGVKEFRGSIERNNSFFSTNKIMQGNTNLRYSFDNQVKGVLGQYSLVGNVNGNHSVRY